jgi:hypothetical protein
VAIEGPQQPSDGPDVDELFEAHVAPTREALTALLDASDHLRDYWGYLPAPDSQAMAELAVQAHLKGNSPWDEEPAQAAHNQGHLLLFGSGDCARALVRELSHRDTPVYAHVVLARAALEHASRAWWLFDPAIGLRRRVARGMNERIFGLYEQRRLSLTEEHDARASERLNGLFAEAARLGFQPVSDSSRARRYLEERRPGQTQLLKNVLSTDGDDSLGALVYGAFSAVAHGTTFGLMSSVEAAAPNVPRPPGMTWGAVGTSSRDVVSVLTAVIVGTMGAHRRRNEFFGWASQSWNETVVRAIEAVKGSFPPGTTASATRS